MNTQLMKIRKSLDALPGDCGSNVSDQLSYDIVEERAISILDSRYMDFESGVLQEFMMSYLYVRQIEYNLIPFPDPEEQ